MWVIHHGKIAVIANLGNPLTEIHYTDKISGETLSVNFVSLSELRQALYSEIPIRRQGISIDAAKELGYGA